MAQPYNAELKDEKRAVPQCFEESPHALGITRSQVKYPLN
jgi:hypothetical protein